MNSFPRMQLLPPYVFEVVNQFKQEARARGVDIVDFGMGNPDQPAAPHITEALQAALKRPDAHRYAMSRGIPSLRQAICQWYEQRYDVDLDPETEAVAVIGSKEGLSHLALATVGPNESVIVPSPCYPIHFYANVIAGSAVHQIPFTSTTEFLALLQQKMETAIPRPKMLIINFPSNPTTQCVELDFFAEIIALAKKYGIWVVHDLAYGDIVFDREQAPSILQIPGAKDIAVEFFTLSKSYNMAGWRVGFMCGNAKLVEALTRLKSYLDYGMFAPIQEAAVAALTGSQDCVKATRELYRQRRDSLCAGLNAAGWQVELPQATMFVWAKIPAAYRHLGSLEFAKQLILQANVAVSPGIGFGEYGDEFVRFGLIENEARIQQALAGINAMLGQQPLLAAA